MDGIRGALEELERNGIDASLINVHTLKPFDKEGIIREVEKSGRKVLVLEEANVIGGLTEATAAALVECDGIRFSHIAIEDRFGQSGETGELLEAYGITVENIVRKAMELKER